MQIDTQKLREMQTQELLDARKEITAELERRLEALAEGLGQKSKRGRPKSAK